MSMNGSAAKAKVDYKMKLYPELQTEYNKARIAEKLVTRDLLKVVEAMGTKLAGIEYSAKTASSVEDKLQRLHKKTYIKPEKLLPKMNDLIRYTQICKHEDIFTMAKKTIETLEQKGYTLCAVNNYYKNNYPKTGYKGLHMNFIAPTGQVFELQVHSEESFAAKQQGHELYEKIRAVSTPLAEKERLEKEINKIHGLVVNPPDYMTMEEYQMEAEEKQKRIEEMMQDTKVAVKHDEEYETETLVYQITVANQVVMEGFEAHQSDGSVIEAEQDKNGLEVSTYTKDGEQVYHDSASVWGIDLKNTPSVTAKINEVVAALWAKNATAEQIALMMGMQEKELLPVAIIAGLLGESKDSYKSLASNYDVFRSSEEKIRNVCYTLGTDRHTALYDLGLADVNVKDSEAVKKFIQAVKQQQNSDIER